MNSTGAEFAKFVWSRVKEQTGSDEILRRNSISKGSSSSSVNSVSPASDDLRETIPSSFPTVGFSDQSETGVKLLQTALEIHKEISALFEAKKHEDDVNGFFTLLPKGADLHLHVTGSIYPDDIIAFAKEKKLYVDPHTFTCFDKETPNSQPVATFIANPINCRDWKERLCMNGQSNKYKFFDACKYGEKILKFVPLFEQLTPVVKEAEAQQINYLEIMIEYVPERPDSSFKELFEQNLSSSSNVLPIFLENVYSRFKNQLDFLIQKLKSKVSQDLKDADDKVANLAKLKTDHPITSIKSQVVVRYILEINRNQSLDNFFIDALAAYQIAQSDPSRIVGINLVGPEDDFFSINDYDFQIGILEFLSKKFKINDRFINLTLHAGELDPKSTACYRVKDRITKVVTQLYDKGLKRIGHGFSVNNDSTEIFTLLRDKNITIEACPATSEAILNSLPPYFLDQTSKCLMPGVTINTDDQGITLKSLSAQYVTVWKTKCLEYRHFVRMNRLGLEAAFLSGESLYERIDRGYLKVKPLFVNLLLETSTPTPEQKLRLDASEKMYLQLKFEKQILAFEKKYLNDIKNVKLTSPLSPSTLTESIPIAYSPKKSDKYN